LHLVGFLLTLNYDARNHKLKIKKKIYSCVRPVQTLYISYFKEYNIFYIRYNTEDTGSSVLYLMQKILYILPINIVVNVNKNPTDATVCRYLFTAKSLYVFQVSQHPS